MAVVSAAIEDVLLQRMSDAPVRTTGELSALSFYAMGTTNRIRFRAGSDRAAREFPEALRTWLAWFEARYSRFIEGSLVDRVNRAGGDWVALEARDEELFALCDWFHWKTHGVFDPTGGTFLRFWDYHRTEARLPEAAEVDALLEVVGWSRVERRDGALRLPHPETRIDFGGIGKEFAVDRIAALAESFGIQDFMISFGRDIRCGGHPPGGSASWRIGLEHPDNADACWSGVGLSGASIASSGSARRFLTIDGKTYGHLIDVRTGWPALTEALATWAIAPSCTEAGILSTAAFILGLEDGLALMEESPHTSGCVWIPERIHLTGRFNRYVLDE